jgi:hypothetical protein
VRIARVDLEIIVFADLKGACKDNSINLQSVIEDIEQFRNMEVWLGGVHKKGLPLALVQST